MSSEIAIRVQGLSKAFPMYERPHHRLLQHFVGSRRKLYKEFWALRDVQFDLGRGETLGIVGRNGSGKSTLLQMVCGTLTPTTGSVEVRGRIAALLELGAGFNPEFTGRENVYLNGAVLGLTRSEIDARFDDIAAFADIGNFIDQPVKAYSSGMYVRLAFAVAISVEPDILIVDEALSVGDEAFQRKCYARIERIRDAGATILFVSHSAGLVTELCNRALLLDHGEQLLLGSPKFVVSRYHKLLYAPSDRLAELRARMQAEGNSNSASEAGTAAAAISAQAAVDEAHFDEGMVPQSVVRYANLGARIEDPHLETPAGRRVNVLVPGGEYVYVYTVHFDRAASGVRYGMLVRTVSGLELAGAVSAAVGDGDPAVAAGHVAMVRFRFRCLMAPGTYFLNAGVLGMLGEGEQYLDRVIDAAMFRVKPDPGRLATALIDLDVRPEIASG